jgi:hypothetical protein
MINTYFVIDKNAVPLHNINNEKIDSTLSYSASRPYFLIIKVYKECNKESESFLVSKKELQFHRIQGIEDWLYLTSISNYPVYENLGVVYVYDISAYLPQPSSVTNFPSSQGRTIQKNGIFISTGALHFCHLLN